METKHSPGPWHIEGEHIFDAILSRVATVDLSDADERTVTGQGETPAGTGRANARLIAAAPALLEACEAMQSCGEHGRVPWVHNAAITDDIEELRKICLAFCSVYNRLVINAINQALGKELVDCTHMAPLPPLVSAQAAGQDGDA